MLQEEFKEIVEKHHKWLEGEKDGRRATIVNDELSDFTIIGVNLSEAIFNGTKFKNINIYESNLSGVEAKYTRFNCCHLFEADFENASMCGAGIVDCTVTDSSFKYADMEYVDFIGSNVIRTAFIRADLSRASLTNTDFDFSDYPLWCGSLDLKIDDRIAAQLLYHLLRNISNNDNISCDFKNALLDDTIINLANKFHRVSECGEIKRKK